MASKAMQIVSKIVVIFFAVIGIIVAISGIYSGNILMGLAMGAAFFILPLFMIRTVVAVLTGVFGKKK